MQWWDHTQPFPESQKTGCPDSDQVRETIWKWGPELYAEKCRDARINVLQCRATGHDVTVAPDPDLYSKFPELYAMERTAEESFEAIQKSGDLPTPLM